MENFLGYAAVIGIVAVMLVVFRQMDRNNRSLDKVRRYVESVKEELNAFVEERTTRIRDYETEYNAHDLAAGEVLNRIKAMKQGLEDHLGDLQTMGQRINDVEGRLGALSQMAQGVDENLSRLKDESEFVDKVGRRLKEAADRLQGLETQIPQIREEFAQVNSQELNQVKAVMMEEFQKDLTAFSHKAQAYQAQVDQYQKFLRSLEDKKEAFLEETQAQLTKTLLNGVKGAEDTLKVQEEKLIQRTQLVQKELEAQEKGFHQRIQDVASKAIKLEDEVLGKLGEQITGLAKSAEERLRKDILSMDNRISEFEKDLAYRIQKLEGFEGDVGQLEKNLRESMERVGTRVQEDFKAFDARMTAKRQDEQAALEVEFNNLKGGMAELEHNLEDLKGRAYENVSEKLQGFEDEFFQDLQKRSATMQETFDAWQKKVASDLADLESSSEKARVEVERGYSDQLRTRLADLQDSVMGQFDKFRGQVTELQDQLSLQVRSYQQVVQDTGLRMKDELLEVEKQAAVKFEQEFARHQLSSNEALQKLDRDLESRMKQISDKLEMDRTGLQASLDASQSDVNIWQTRFTQRIKEVEAEISEQYRNFKGFIGEKIDGLSKEFAAQKEDLVDRTSEERQALRGEIATLRGEVEALELALRQKSEAALDGFKRDFEGFSNEQQKKIREISAEIDLKVRDFRSSVEDTREKSEAMAKKIFGKIEDQYNLLNVNLEEIDKKQKSFLAQTKLFERADSLKQELQESIEDLKNDLAKIDIQRKELFEMEGQLSRVKKVTDEVSEKLARFMAEKKRIDALDTDFQRVISLSQAMELRLEQVTESHDSLQDIQMKIRKLEDYQKEVDGRYERLEKRREVLDSTTDGVDRNFSLLERMEKSVKTLSGELSAMPAEVEEIKKRLKILSQGREDADAAIAKVTQLDRVVRDIEDRISRMDEVRDWLARAETRLQEANKEAEEQVRLLGTLARGSSNAATKPKGAPTSDVRQSVVKLARQGWSKEEISRATKLSMGEVELILELGPRS